jgi:hypothetical protein
VLCEAVGAAPVAHDDQDGAQRQQLPDLHPHAERDQVGDQPVGRDLELQDPGRQAEAETSFYLCYPARRQASPALCGLINYLLGMRQAR